MKQISSRFSMAVHTLTLIATMPGECTGDIIAGSVNTNPVVIRRIMGMLKKAGFIEVRAGVGGASLLKEPSAISLLDVYHAVEAIDKGHLFHIHNEPNLRCPVGRTIQVTLHDELAKAQYALESQLAGTTIQQMLDQAIVNKSSQ